MSAADRPDPASSVASTDRPGTRHLLTVVAWLIPAGVFAQAVLAGQGWFANPALFGLHGGIGHGVLLLSVLLVPLLWLVHGRPLLVGMAVVSLAGLIAQTGLGYAGRRSGLALASSLHIPLGAALLALTTVLAVLVVTSRPGRERP